MKRAFYQKGFIQIPLLAMIVISILTASVGAGFVLHKQGKLSFLSADVINPVLRNVNLNPQEVQKSDKENNKEVEQKEDNKIAEPKREIEKPRNQTDVSPSGDGGEATTQSQSFSIYPQAQDPQIKIEVCKIEAQASIKNFLEVGKMAANEGFQKCVQNRLATLQQQLGGGGVALGTLEAMADLARSSCKNSAQEGLDFLQSKANEIYNRQYLECLNR